VGHGKFLEKDAELVGAGDPCFLAVDGFEEESLRSGIHDCDLPVVIGVFCK
jgi:hypothetical protein